MPDDGSTSSVVVVGGGHAGGALTVALRQLGHAGPVTVIGEEDEPPYERPALSKAMLRGEADPRYLADGAHWAAGCALRLGTQVARLARDERRAVLGDGTAIPYDHLVLATGGRARRLAPPLHAHPRVRLLRTAADARALRTLAEGARSAVVVGGGVIGLEVAASLRAAGLAVDVVEAGARVLGRNVPAEAAAWMTDLHRRNGVRLHVGRNVVGLADAAGAPVLSLCDGRSLAPDLVVVGVGIEPRTELAQAAGLACADGVRVDARYRSVTDPRVLAIGDVAARGDGRRETWAHAAASARAAARAILGLAPEPDEVPWFWTDQFGATLQVAGQPDAADATIARGDRVRLYLRAGRTIGAACLDRPRDFAIARRLIAAGARIDAGRAGDAGRDLRQAVAA